MSRADNRRVSGGSGRFQKGNRAGVRNRFRPGVSGNPKGRPRTKIVREVARRVAEETDPKTQRAIAEELVQTLVSRALRGSLGHFKQFLELVESDGPGARSNVRGSGPDGEKLAGKLRECFSIRENTR